jgi:LCP family protein required for cell wall assembly
MDDTPPRPAGARSPRQRLVIGTGLGLVVVILAVIAGAGYIWYRYNQIEHADLDLDAANSAAQNFLIVGSDTREVVDEDDADSSAFFDGNDDPGGKRSDTIMIARVDPSAKTIDLVSFPRDLWVPIAETGSNERINTAYAADDGPQRLVDTIRQDFGITINHYVEIDFKSFTGIVDAVDGVPMAFQTPMRDRRSGFYLDQAGCSVLDGDQALAFARSRHLEYMDPSLRWVPDSSFDLGRINRQQVFMRSVIDRAAASTKGFDLKTMNDLLASTTDHLKVDSGLDLGQMVKLARHFREFRGDQLRTHTLPVYASETAGGAAIVRLDATAAKPIFDVFRGLAPDDVVVRPDVHLAIENASGIAGQAADAQLAFESLGFDVERTSTALTLRDVTMVRHAPGSEVVAGQVAEHLAPAARLQTDPTLAADELVIVTGKDFEAVTENGQPVATTGTNGTSTSSIPLEQEVTEPIGVVPEALEGLGC